MGRFSFSCLSMLFVLLFFFGCKKENTLTYDVILKNGNVIDLETGYITLKDILITDGRIEKLILPNDDETISATKVIDVTDQYILPGFWDNHVHFRGGDSLIAANKEFLNLYIANGITTVRDAGGDLTAAVVAWRDSIASGDLMGPTIFTSGPKIDGPNGTWAGSLEVTNKIDIAIALDSLQSIPVDFVKLYDSRITGGNYLNTIKAAEQRGLITSGHMPFTVTLDETISAGVDAVEHLYYIMKGASAQEKEITARLIQK
jgi:imidazolonepropionase-like amidohydrolase